MTIPIEIAAAILTGALTLLGYFVKSAHSTLEKHGVQIAEIKTAMTFMSDVAARALHSPHTPELDALLDKKLARTMTTEDWAKLKAICLEIEADKTRDKQERALAGQLILDCLQALNEPIPGKVPHHD